MLWLLTVDSCDLLWCTCPWGEGVGVTRLVVPPLFLFMFVFVFGVVVVVVVVEQIYKPVKHKYFKITITCHLSTYLSTCQTPLSVNTNMDRGGTTNLVTPTPSPQLQQQQHKLSTTNSYNTTKHTYDIKPVPKPVPSAPRPNVTT